MDLGLKGKKAIVTGGSRGIGRSIADQLADEGVNLAICARKADGLQAAADALQARGVNVFCKVVDVSNAELTAGSIRGLTRKIKEEDTLVRRE